jgi:hypothetical protein
VTALGRMSAEFLPWNGDWRLGASQTLSAQSVPAGTLCQNCIRVFASGLGNCESQQVGLGERLAKCSRGNTLKNPDDPNGIGGKLRSIVYDFPLSLIAAPIFYASPIEFC